MTNKVIVDLKDQPKLAEYLGRKEDGDTCELTLKVSVEELTPEQAVLSIESLSVMEDGKEVAGDESDHGDAVDEEESSDNATEEAAPGDNYEAATGKGGKSLLLAVFAKRAKAKN